MWPYDTIQLIGLVAFLEIKAFFDDVDEDIISCISLPVLAVSIIYWLSQVLQLSPVNSDRVSIDTNGWVSIDTALGKRYRCDRYVH